VARPRAGLFVFTFSRNTFPPQTEPVVGEPFVFTQFSGEPQCFLTEAQLVAELARVGFAPDHGVPCREYAAAALVDSLFWRGAVGARHCRHGPSTVRSVSVCNDLGTALRCV